MLSNNIKIYQSNIENNCVKVNEVGINDLIIVLPLEGFTINISTPLFDIESISPAEISLIGITPNEFRLLVFTPEFQLITIVPSLVLEVFNPEGVRIIRIVAPPE